MPNPSRSPQAWNAAQREKLRRAGVVDFLIDVMQGKPIPVRDAAGRIVDWQDSADTGQRISVAQALANKLLPGLQAQAIDVTSNGQGMLQIVLGDGLAPPGSVDDTDAAIDITPDGTPTPEPATIEHTPAPPAPMPEPPARPRRRRKSSQS